MEAAPETDAELQFRQDSVQLEDGQRVVRRPSAVQRMRNKQEVERREREQLQASTLRAPSENPP